MRPSNKVYEDGLPCKVVECFNFADDAYDGVVLVADVSKPLEGAFEVFQKALQPIQQIDTASLTDVCVVPCDLPSHRLICSPTGPLNRDYDDVRRWSDAARVGVQRAVRSGCKSILLVRGPGTQFPLADAVTVLGALHGLYVPIEIREDVPQRATKVDVLGVWNDGKSSSNLLEYCAGIERGRGLARDLGGSDPERMCPSRFAEHVLKEFSGTGVDVKIVKGQDLLEREYPLFAAVNRGSEGEEKFRGCIIYLEYTGEGQIEETLMLVGKGVTYDTGGHDLKTGGIMAGMHRDKCGASAVAGFFKTVASMRPKNIKVVGGLAVVRNAISLQAYVSDELITSRAGRRVRVKNTDAEGRMAMADVLCRMKELAAKEVNPHLMTLATLTGHAVIAFGEEYSAVMDNGPARQKKFAQHLQEAGDKIGDMLEISTVRREDYAHHKGQSEYEDIVQSTGKPSSQEPRGHQCPCAFLIMASGLDKHGIDSECPLRYSHLDLSSAGPYPGVPTGAPVAALAHKYFSSCL